MRAMSVQQHRGGLETPRYLGISLGLTSMKGRVSIPRYISIYDANADSRQPIETQESLRVADLPPRNSPAARYGEDIADRNNSDNDYSCIQIPDP